MYSTICIVLYVPHPLPSLECCKTLSCSKDSIRLSFGYLRDSKWNSTYNPYTIPWPKNYNKGGDASMGHMYHCLNGIRQSLQCFSDVTPQVYQYQENKNKIISNFDVLHTCRNFEAVCTSLFEYLQVTDDY